MIKSSSNNKLWREVFQAALLWPIWMRIGLQDIRIRYRRSALGIGWIFLNLIVMLSSVGLIYSHLLGQDLKKFLPFLTIGLVIWGYITSSIIEGGNAFLASEGYIKQIGLPLYIYIFRFFVSITTTLLISLPAYFIVALAYSVQFRWGALWALVGLFLLGSVSFLLIAIFSHLNVRFRDLPHVASSGLQVLFFATPIIWPPETLRFGKLRWVVDLNPFYHLLEVIRRPLIMSEPASYVDYLVVILLIIVLSILVWLFTKTYSLRIAYLL
jgi:ABC-type polysaccharide/polyol phosphate export permease